MSFAEGFRTGTDAVNSYKANERAEKQQQLTALSQGYNYDEESKKYVPTANKKTEQDLKTEALQAQLEAVTASNRTLQSQQSADAITNAMDSIIDGDWHNANLAYSKVKDVMSKQPNLNVSDIGPINFADPRDTEQLKNLGIDMNIVGSDTEVHEVYDALNRSLIKVTGNDGQTRIMPVDQIMKSTNSWNMMNTQQRDRYTQNSRNIMSVLDGKGITGKEQKAGEATAEEITSKAELQAQKDTAMSEAIATGDAKEVMQTLMLTNPEKFIGQDGVARRDALLQATTAFKAAYPNATPEQWQQFNADFLQGKTEGVGAVAKEKDVAQLTTEQTKAIEEPKTPKTPGQLLDSENKIFSNLDTKKKALATEDISTMKSNFHLSNNLNRVLKDQATKVDTDAIADAKTWVQKKLGMESEQAMKNVDFTTSSGILLAKFIKEMSGTAVAAFEFSNLENMMLGGDLTDETYVRQAIASFAKELDSQNIEIGSTLKDTAPYSVDKYTRKTEKPTVSAADFD